MRASVTGVVLVLAMVGLAGGEARAVVTSSGGNLAVSGGFVFQGTFNLSRYEIGSGESVDLVSRLGQNVNRLSASDSKLAYVTETFSDVPPSGKVVSGSKQQSAIYIAGLDGSAVEKVLGSDIQFADYELDLRGDALPDAGTQCGSKYDRMWLAGSGVYALMSTSAPSLRGAGECANIRDSRQLMRFADGKRVRIAKVGRDETVHLSESGSFASITKPGRGRVISIAGPKPATVRRLANKDSSVVGIRDDGALLLDVRKPLTKVRRHPPFSVRLLLRGASRSILVAKSIAARGQSVQGLGFCGERPLLIRRRSAGGRIKVQLNLFGRNGKTPVTFEPPRTGGIQVACDRDHIATSSPGPPTVFPVPR